VEIQGMETLTLPVGFCCVGMINSIGVLVGD
jgi:hypothetical protein